MSLYKNELIRGILHKPTIFICGEDEMLCKHSIQQMLLLKFEKPLEHLYFIKPPKNVIEFLEEEATMQNYTIVQNVEEINDFYRFNIIACGIKVDSQDFIEKIKNFKNQMIVFFLQLGLFRTKWTSLGKNILIREQSFNDFICDVVVPIPYFSESLHKSQRNESEFFFTNRGRALDDYRNFKADKNKRCCIIIGVRGMGKRAFVNKLMISGLTNNVDHYCIHKNDDLIYVLKYLLGRFNVQYKESEIPISLDTYKVDPILKKLFTAFDRHTSTNLIFYNIDIIYDIHKQQFYDQNIAIFFKHLLQRPSYNGNKVYMTSEYKLNFNVLQSDIFQTIYINAMSAEYIKYILEYEFGKPERDSSAYATAIMQYEDKVIDELIGGYPPIAHVFVAICTEYSIEEVINKGFVYSIFEKKKLDELIDFIKLEDSELAILSYLALFRKHFTLEAAQIFQSDARTVLEHLKRRLLLEKIQYEKHTVFYVPSFIQDYVISISEDRMIKANHNRIGDYYWTIAESKNQNHFEQLENYRLALYHYEAANNINKQQLLFSRFTGIFMNTAYELYSTNKIEEAYSAYEFLYEQGVLTNEKHLNYFLICSTKLKKQKTQEIFEKVTEEFPKNVFIQCSYAHYLYSIGDYNNAEKICLKAQKIDENNYVVVNLYAKIVNKKGEKEKAILILEKEINKFQFYNSRSRVETKALIRYLMTYFTIIDYYSTFQTVLENIGLYLKSDGMADKRIKEIFIQLIPLDAEAKILALFKKAANHKMRNKLLFSSYATFLKRQGKYSEANKIIKQMSEVEYIYRVDPYETESQSLDIEHVLEKVIMPLNEKLSLTNKEKSIEQIIHSSTNRLHNAEVQYEFLICKEKMKQAQAKLKTILTIEPEDFQALSALCLFYQNAEYLKNIEKASNDYYKTTNEVYKEMKNDIEQNYLAGSPISAQKKGYEVIRRLNERNIDLNNYGFINLGGGDGTELFIEIENTPSSFGLLIEYDYNSVKRFNENQNNFYLKNPNRKIHTEVIECDLGDKKKFEAAKQIIRDKNLDGLVITIHAVLHELSTRSHFKPFDFFTFFMRIYDLHDNILLFIREPGVPENWTEKIKIILKEEYKSDFVRILIRVNEIHFRNESSNYELFDTGEIICNPVLAIEALTNFFYKEDFEYEKDEQHTSISRKDLVSYLRESKFEILESEPFYSDSMKRNIQHFEVKVSGLNGEHISLPQCFTYTVAKKGILNLISY